MTEDSHIDFSPLELIDQKIEHYQATLIDLKIQRNKLLPISKIPPEVLYNIFFIASRDVQGRGLRWIKLTYVCRDWRDLALSSPSLWSNPPFQNPRWAKEMLLRSKTANLTIETEESIFTNSEKRSILCNTFKTQMSQIKCIKVNLPSRPTELFENLPRCAPNLKSLSLYRFAGWAKHLRSANNPDIPTMDLPLGSLCETDQLQHMYMSGVGIDWDSHLPSSLTSLVIDFIRASSHPTMTQVWDALERMQLLETLELRCALPTLTTPIIPNRSIHLDRLQNLTLETGIPVTEAFLQTVIIPPTATFDIRCFQDSPSGYADVNSIIELLGQSAKNSSESPKNKCLTIHYSRSSYVPANMTGNMSTMKFSSLPDKNPKNPFHLFQISWYRGDRFGDDYTLPERILQSVFRHFPFEFLNTLYLYGFVYRFSLPTLLHTFGPLPNLQTLVGCLGSSILNTLQSHLPPSENVTIPRVSFSSLRSLNIEEMVCSERARHSRGEISIQNLIDCLTWRDQHGVPVQELDLKDCLINQGDVDRLKNAVTAQVEWDGLTPEDFDSDSDSDSE